MKYRCLILDHDDTVVNSTATVHYPSFLGFAKRYKPGVHFSLEEFFRYNFEPGVLAFFRDMVGLDDEELRVEEAFWREFVSHHVPKAYPGIREMLLAYREKGGIICVSSHSFKENILRDYRENDLPLPDAVYGWELPNELRKPAPYAIHEIEKAFQLRPEEILVVDDLKPGHDMARAAGVSFAAAGWANDIPEIENFMRKNSDHYFKTVREFAAFVGES